MIVEDGQIDNSLCPNPSIELKHNKLLFAEDSLLSYFLTWRKCGLDEAIFLQQFRKRNIPIPDSSAMVIVADLLFKTLKPAYNSVSTEWWSESVKSGL